MNGNSRSNSSTLNNNAWYMCMKKNMKVSSGYCECCNDCENNGIIIKPLKEMNLEASSGGRFK
jgi:hypothetical protein